MSSVAGSVTPSLAPSEIAKLPILKSTDFEKDFNLFITTINSVPAGYYSLSLHKIIDDQDLFKKLFLGDFSEFKKYFAPKKSESYSVFEVSNRILKIRLFQDGNDTLIVFGSQKSSKPGEADNIIAKVLLPRHILFSLPVCVLELFDPEKLKDNLGSAVYSRLYGSNNKILARLQKNEFTPISSSSTVEKPKLPEVRRETKPVIEKPLPSVKGKEKEVIDESGYETARESDPKPSRTRSASVTRRDSEAEKKAAEKLKEANDKLILEQQEAAAKKKAAEEAEIERRRIESEEREAAEKKETERKAAELAEEKKAAAERLKASIRTDTDLAKRNRDQAETAKQAEIIPPVATTSQVTVEQIPAPVSVPTTPQSESSDRVVFDADSSQIDRIIDLSLIDLDSNFDQFLEIIQSVPDGWIRLPLDRIKGTFYNPVGQKILSGEIYDFAKFFGVSNSNLCFFKIVDKDRLSYRFIQAVDGSILVVILKISRNFWGSINSCEILDSYVTIPSISTTKLPSDFSKYVDSSFVRNSASDSEIKSFSDLTGYLSKNGPTWMREPLSRVAEEIQQSGINRSDPFLSFVQFPTSPYFYLKFGFVLFVLYWLRRIFLGDGKRR